VLYLDTSALVKLLVTEAETLALTEYLDARSEVRIVTSMLARAELLRAVVPSGAAAAMSARRLLAAVDQVPMPPDLLDEAASLPPAVLRTLDAIHLASARRLQPDLEAVVTYDERMLLAADALDLPGLAPGR
jgi:uncharacterized protein